MNPYLCTHHKSTIMIMGLFKKKKKENVLSISSIESITADAITISFDIPEESKKQYQFQAGQYVTLQADINGETIKRSYSICSSPKDAVLQVGIKKIKNGIFSEYAHQKLKQGDALVVNPPEGRFVINKDKAYRHITLVAVGSGITPIMSIIKDQLDNTQTNVLLIYGNKSVKDSMFSEELKALQKQYSDRFQIINAYSQEETGDIKGRLTPEKIHELLPADTPNQGFFICGPEQLTTDTVSFLKDKGVDAATIFYELFFTKTSETEESGENTANDTVEITVTIDQQTKQFQMPRNQSILEAVKKQDLNPPYSCQGGVCASCIAKTEGGEVTMKNNHVLTDGELKEGLILTCQSYCTTDSITVNYDEA